MDVPSPNPTAMRADGQDNQVPAGQRPLSLPYNLGDDAGLMPTHRVTPLRPTWATASPCLGSIVHLVNRYFKSSKTATV